MGVFYALRIIKTANLSKRVLSFYGILSSKAIKTSGVGAKNYGVSRDWKHTCFFGLIELQWCVDEIGPLRHRHTDWKTDKCDKGTVDSIYSVNKTVCIVLIVARFEQHYISSIHNVKYHIEYLKCSIPWKSSTGNKSINVYNIWNINQWSLRSDV